MMVQKSLNVNGTRANGINRQQKSRLCSPGKFSSASLSTLDGRRNELE